jgi:cytochrome c553
MDKRNKKFGQRLMRWIGAAAIASMVSGVAFAAGITDTKHNLTSTGAGPNKQNTTDQICVFCHTPHGSDTSAPVPLWNKKMNVTGATYTTYDSLNTSTLDGAVLSVGSVSLACLSCHDGTQAMDNIINAPGSGGYVANGGGAAGIGLNWNAGAKTLSDAPIPMLGTDLRNDHPIGIEYCGGGLTGSSTTVSGTCKDTDFVGASSTTTSDGRTALVKTASVNSNQIFWVDVDGSSGRGKGDIQLYTRDFSGKGGAAAGPSVECGSCHDPHVESKNSDNIMFMRVTTAGSKICLSCHVK